MRYILVLLVAFILSVNLAEAEESPSVDQLLIIKIDHENVVKVEKVSHDNVVCVVKSWFTLTSGKPVLIDVDTECSLS